MRQLNFPTYSFRLKNSENKIHIFDVIRKKFVVLQPEEWVRQHIVHHLIYDKNYPRSLVNVEKQLKLNDLKKRYDIVVFNPDASIEVLVECKSPETKINQTVFDQIAIYNMNLRANYLMVSNGLEHFYCKMDFEEEKYTFLRQLPDFSR
ncbi:type I restriction enzyme HsdR N-terminal domain-containing protein [Flavobacteriaceae bacterium F89]|uniref:Type I restriction enzyme HsdR N-terminal domain-containing protein n=1 Tax=Cerina litoralis TaxID=2874477 RepID=A0AAE3JPH6_9FLAO|nr:type I restriction enzyme HsdR N-terminal domain-containing protein [Cerina litoralis]MCG2460784.1 type I restriction enzyme HsdR N-terminal domain-containing protein [Cerina litoralis]